MMARCYVLGSTKVSLSSLWLSLSMFAGNVPDMQLASTNLLLNPNRRCVCCEYSILQRICTSFRQARPGIHFSWAHSIPRLTLGPCEKPEPASCRVPISS
jgi:hypothetical protein